jgi:hypothetical protein
MQHGQNQRRATGLRHTKNTVLRDPLHAQPRQHSAYVLEHTLAGGHVAGRLLDLFDVSGALCLAPLVQCVAGDVGTRSNKSGRQRLLTVAPHTTHHAGPQWAVQQVGSLDEAFPFFAV